MHPRSSRPAVLSLALAVLAVGEAQGQICGLLGGVRHVTFGERSLRPDPSGVVRVYLDMYGAVYPGGESPQLRLPDEGLARAGSLKSYFAAERADWAHLRAGLGIGQDRYERQWERAQAALKARLTRRIADLTADGRTLVVLVHGFNVKTADDVFAAVRDTVRRRYFREGRVGFLEVHWDGMTGHPLCLSSVWERAQYNAPLVGLELRDLLAGVRHDVPVRILTHSLGAAVIATALWGRKRGTFHGDAAYGHLRAHAGGTGLHPLPPQPNLRVAMIVPAVPGTAFPPAIPRGIHEEARRRVVIGQNQDDFAVTKGPLPAKILGSTSLGVAEDEFCTYVHAVLQKSPVSTAHRADFRRSPGNARFLGFWDDHSLGVYLQRRAIVPFLDMLLHPQPPVLASGECRDPKGRGSVL